MAFIGIDLGTTNSVIAVSNAGKSQAIAVADWNVNHNLMPSVVDFSNPTKPAVFKNAHQNGQSLVRSIKRKMGTDFKIYNKNPSEISSVILSELTNAAAQKIGENIDYVVIGVPAYFDNTQRLATKLAASYAGIKVLRLINEPTAAAMAYGLEKQQNGIFCVYDLGGGTFDFSILRLENSVFQVLAVAGDNALGGDDIDKDIARVCCDRYGANFDALSDIDQGACLAAARELKEKKAGSIYLALSKFTAEFYITEDELTSIMNLYTQKTLDIANKALIDAGLKLEEVNSVVLVGGMTKSKELQNYLKCRCNILCDINPDETVAIGAALYAESILSKSKNSLLIDVTPLSLGVETLGGGVDKVILRNSPLPFTQTIEYTTAENNQCSMAFNIVQGEMKLANQCRSLGRFELHNIPPMPAGAARILVTFKIDVNGILSVTAKEETTGVSQSIITEPANGLTSDDYIRLMAG